MRWKQRENYIQNEDSQIVCILPDGVDDAIRQIIVNAPRMLEAINEFIGETDSGSMPAKRFYNRFKNIVEGINEE